MKYQSTRGQMPEKSFKDVLLMGLAPDGGLAVPKEIPVVDEKTLKQWQNLRYTDLAFEIMRLFIDDIDETTLKTLIENAYTEEKFHHKEITPLRFLDKNTAILGLSNGPTLAFKDIAMQMIGELFEHALSSSGKQLNIIGATSGDTGSAAESAMIGKTHVNVFMLSPHGRMSPFQQAQMFSILEPNIVNISVKGVFDDCQDLVKAINSDADFKAKNHIGAVNSINWARILAQVVYYFKGYFLAIAEHPDETINFVVPSGNFGNVYAGFVAKQMGLPIAHLVVATNENDVLDEFFKTGIYRVRKSADVHATSSPSMDIGKASNFERYLFDLFGKDSKKIRDLWDDIGRDSALDLHEVLDKIKASGFLSGKSTHADRLKTIAAVYARYHTLIDPHTADGVFVCESLQKAGQLSGLSICLETALPAKFADTIEEATGFLPPLPKGFEDLEERPRRVSVIDNDAESVKTIVLHHQPQNR